MAAIVRWGLVVVETALGEGHAGISIQVTNRLDTTFNDPCSLSIPLISNVHAAWKGNNTTIGQTTKWLQNFV